MFTPNHKAPCVKIALKESSDAVWAVNLETYEVVMSIVRDPEEDLVLLLNSTCVNAHWPLHPHSVICFCAVFRTMPLSLLLDKATFCFHDCHSFFKILYAMYSPIF